MEDLRAASGGEGIQLEVELLVIGGGFTAYSYVNNRAAQIQSATIESQKPFLQKQLDFYIDASSTVAVLVNSKDQAEVTKAKEHFWNLYWGPLRMVADFDVSISMGRIAECIDKNPHCDTVLQNLAIELNHNCSASLTKNWGAISPASPSDLQATAN
jgi:hypothetical protein